MYGVQGFRGLVAWYCGGFGFGGLGVSGFGFRVPGLCFGCQGFQISGLYFKPKRLLST